MIEAMMLAGIATAGNATIEYTTTKLLDKIKGIMQVFQMNDEALESKFLSQALDSAQQKVEGFYLYQFKNFTLFDSYFIDINYLIYEPLLLNKKLS